MDFINKLSDYLNVAPEDLLSSIEGASVKYKVFRIPKRTHGFRIIAQPSKEIKVYQRAFLKCYPLPVHPAAKGYVKGSNIKANSLPHKDNKYLLKLDLQNFFLRLTPDIFWRLCDKYPSELSYTTSLERDLINQLLFWSPSRRPNKKLVLSIGAPSSPSISNFCMLSFDENVDRYCQTHSITYSRYADDLSFSSNDGNQLMLLIPFIQNVLNTEFFGKQSLNPQKMAFLSKAQNRHITGLTLTPNGSISIGRRKKRLVKHFIHQFTLSKLTNDDTLKLRGWLAFIKDVEPEFLLSLSSKYSYQTIFKIWTYNDARNKQDR